MEWTAENNKATINGLLDDYADLLAVYREFVDQNLDAELPTKLKALQTLKSLATTIDTLLKRWSFAYRGYDGNTHQAREDATRSLAERTSLTDSEEEDDFHDGRRCGVGGTEDCLARATGNGGKWTSDGWETVHTVSRTDASVTPACQKDENRGCCGDFRCARVG